MQIPKGQTMITKLNYDRLDCECCQGAFQRYFEYGIATGGFLQACLEDRLWDAVGRADDNHINRLKNIVQFIYNELPTCVTGEGNFNLWCNQGGASMDDRFSNRSL